MDTKKSRFFVKNSPKLSLDMSVTNLTLQPFDFRDLKISLIVEEAIVPVGQFGMSERNEERDTAGRAKGEGKKEREWERGKRKTKD
jgi:hypothetical protein